MTCCRPLEHTSNELEKVKDLGTTVVLVLGSTNLAPESTS